MTPEMQEYLIAAARCYGASNPKTSNTATYVITNDKKHPSLKISIFVYNQNTITVFWNANSFEHTMNTPAGRYNGSDDFFKKLLDTCKKMAAQPETPRIPLNEKQKLFETMLIHKPTTPQHTHIRQR